MEVFDPATGQWTSRPPLPTARATGAVVELGGAIYVIGGNSGSGTDPALVAVDRFDPTTNSWTSSTPLPRRLGQLGAAVLNGRIYVLASYEWVGTTPVPTQSVLVYDPATNAWTEGPPYLFARYEPRPQTIDGVIYVGGNGYGNQPTADFEAFVGSAPPTPAGQRWPGSEGRGDQCRRRVGHAERIILR